MADALLKVMLTDLSSLIKGELGLVFGFEKEFEKLSNTFSTIQTVLEDAQMKQVKDKALENWLKKLNTAAYEVDDIVDACKTEAVRLRQSRLGSYHPGIIIFRYKMGKRMKEVMGKLDAIAEEKSKFHLHEGTAEKLDAIVRSETGYVLTEKEVYGREKEENEIVKILLNKFNNSQELSVLPIVGMGGLGKTTIAQKIFNDERMTTHFNPIIWVCVSDVFDEKRLIKTITECIVGHSVGLEDLASLQKMIRELLTGKKYLLVLDDVWNEDQEKWAKLRAVLEVGSRGASVLITTRLDTVGSIVGTLTPYQLSTLSLDDCWLVFMGRAFGQEREMNPTLVAIGKEIVKKCGGVPLAAKSLGSFLRFSREESEWKNVRDSEIWNLPQDETSIFPALRLSYHHLPLHLRRCFVYCAVYPKDAKMEKNKLISLWMAHGFLSSKRKLELEDVGNKVWKELYLRSFFQEVEEVNKFGETHFKMHDLLHDFATLLMTANSSNCKIRQAAVGMNKQFISVDGFSEVVSSYTPSLLENYASLRVLDLHNSGLDELPSSIGDLIHLRVLDLSHTDIKTLPKRLCKLKNLQALNLKYCGLLSCLPKQTSKLSSLRVLSLLHCPLEFIPPRIGLLTWLKTLDKFVVGKAEGSQLCELRNLDLHGSLCITHLERVKNVTEAKEANLSAKENLLSLDLNWWYKRGECESEYLDDRLLEALAPHPNLKFIEIKSFRGSCLPNWMNGSVLKNVVNIKIINSFTNCVQLPPFGELPCLEYLELTGRHANVEYVEDNVDDCGRFPSLRELYIGGFPNLKGLMKKEGKEKFPILEEVFADNCPMLVFPTLVCVKKLFVIGNADATTLSSISHLSNLTSLYIVNGNATSLPEDVFKSLANLEYMHIRDFQNLKELPTNLTSLKALKRLCIHDCHELQSLPTSISKLKNLQELKITCCPELEKSCEREVGKEWHKIAHIPNVMLY